MIPSSDPLSRTPPHDRGAEKGILGGILRDPDILPDVQDALAVRDFYSDAHQKIYQAICDLASECQPIDLVTLHDTLRKRQQLEDAGGASYLAELWDTIPTGANAKYHAQLVRDAAMIRGLIHASNEVLRDAYDRTQSAAELVADAERRVMAVADGATQSSEAECAADLSRALLQRIDQRAANEGPTGYPTGYADLDAILFGLHPGQLVVLGARPGAGKTAFALSVLLNLTRAGIPTLLFSLEMPSAEIMDRAASVRSGVPLSAIRSGKVTGDQVDRIMSAADQLARETFFIDDRSDLSASRLAAVVRRYVRRKGVKVVVVDYLQLMAPENPRDNRTQQVGLMARRAKMLARACGVPVLMLSQLNREVENREGGKPRLSDLRESGEVEQHADVVLFLAPQGSNPDEPVWRTDVIVAKNRNGPIGEITLGYRRTNTRFENFQPEFM